MDCGELRCSLYKSICNKGMCSVKAVAGCKEVQRCGVVESGVSYHGKVPAYISVGFVGQ